MAAPCFNMPPDAWELFDISAAPSMEGLERYLDRVLLHCERLFDASRVSIFLRSPGEESYRLAARRGASAGIPTNAVIEPGVGLAGEVIVKRASALIHSRSDSQNVGSAMVVPLVDPRGVVLGVLNVARRVSQPPFGQTDLRYGDTVAGQLALAVGNATLYSEARQAEARLRAILEAVPTAMFVLDDSGEITARNATARDLGKHPALDKTGRHEVDGRAFWLTARDVPTGGRIVTVDDVTERERAAAEAVKLRHLAEIGQMTATIAHEIRNPLTGIRSAAQMLSEVPEHASEWGGIVEREATRMEQLCEQFLAFARPMEPRLGMTDLSEVALRVATVFQPQFSDAELQLMVSTETRGECIPADSAQVEQVLHNLLRNALQASEAGQSVLLEVRKSSIRVRDQGRGMSEDELANAGRPFFTSKTRGSGLGLGTVKKIVEAHHGRLLIESKLGKGTTVTVEFPESHL